MYKEMLVSLKTEDEQREEIIRELKRLVAEEVEAKKYFRDEKARLYKQLKKVNGDA